MTLSLTFPAPDLALHGFPNEVGALLTFLQNGVDPLQSSLREPGGGLLVVDLSASHDPHIDDITNCYKSLFSRYHLLHTHQIGDISYPIRWEIEMTRLRQRLTRYQAISLLIEYKVIAPENRQDVLGSETEIDFAFGGIDAHKDGFFRREDVLRLVSYHRMAE